VILVVVGSSPISHPNRHWKSADRMVGAFFCACCTCGNWLL